MSEAREIRKHNERVARSNIQPATVPEPPDDIAGLIDDYNRVEHEQEARLQRLYAYMLNRRGYRRVNFTGEAWTNFQNSDRNDLGMARYVSPFITFITGIEPGLDAD